MRLMALETQMYLPLNNKQISNMKIKESSSLCLDKEYKFKDSLKTVDVKGNIQMNVCDFRDGNKRGPEAWYSLHKGAIDIKEEKWSWVTVHKRVTRTLSITPLSWKKFWKGHTFCNCKQSFCIEVLGRRYKPLDSFHSVLLKKKKRGEKEKKERQRNFKSLINISR